MTTYHTVFISYSHVQATIVDRLKQDLRGQGIHVWIDHESLTPGTRSWEAAIRKGIQATDVLLYLASPEALASNNVQGELDVAEYFQKPVIPLWVAGEHWVQAVPMAMSKMQHIDARGARYAQAVQELWRTLGITGTGAAPLPVPVPIPQHPNWDEIAIPTRLDRLGFAGWRDKKTGVSFIIAPNCPVAEGKFTMGSDPSDPQASDSEKGQYSIPVGAFEIGTYPVTVAEYALYLQANPKAARPQDREYPKDATWVAPEWRGKTLTWALQQQRADHPVVCVSWADALDYTQWLAQATGQPWRLPTEAEWEKAARWDTSVNPPHARIYPWGDQWDKARANTADDGPKLTTPVGAYADKGDASPSGAHDMAGNVWEWTSTLWYTRPEYYSSKYENDSDRTSYRVLRGGSWSNVPHNARVACRSYIDFDVGGWGFRLARGRR